MTKNLYYTRIFAPIGFVTLASLFIANATKHFLPDDVNFYGTEHIEEALVPSLVLLASAAVFTWNLYKQTSSSQHPNWREHHKMSDVACTFSCIIIGITALSIMALASPNPEHSSDSTQAAFWLTYGLTLITSFALFRSELKHYDANEREQANVKRECG